VEQPVRDQPVANGAGAGQATANGAGADHASADQAGVDQAAADQAAADQAAADQAAADQAAADQAAAEPETQPLTRASIRAAQALRLAAEAEERRLASLAEESAVPRGIRALAVISAVALAVLIGLSALVSVMSTAFAVAFAAVVLVWGWVRLTDAPSPRPAALVLAAGSVAICATAALTRTEPYLVWVPVAVAVSLVAAFLHQVLRGGGRPRLTEGVASSVGALALVASGAAYIPVPYYPHGGPWVLVSVVGVAGAAVPALLLGRRLSPAWVLLGAVVLGTAAAVVTAAFMTGVPLGWAALAGLVVAGLAHPMMRVLFALPGAKTTPAAAAVGAAPVLSVGVVVYLLARIFAG
jgi:hypothetical protein